MRIKQWAPSSYSIPIITMLGSKYRWLHAAIGALLFYATATLANEPSIREHMEARRAAAHRCFGSNFELIYERVQSTALQPKASPLLGKREEISRVDSQWWKRSHYTTDFQTGKPLAYPSDIDWLSDGFNLRLEGQRSAAISDYRTEGNVARRLYFTRHLGIDLSAYMYEELEQPPKIPDTYQFNDFPYLNESLESGDRSYKLENSDITIQGSKCILLSSEGYDRILLCPAFDYSIISRQLNWNRSGARRIEIRNSDFKQFDGEVWLPQQQEVTEYPFPGDTAGADANQPLHRSVYRLTKFTKDVSDINFASPSVSPGTMVINNVTDEIYRVPTGTAIDPFDEQVVEGIRLIAESPKHSRWRVAFVLLNIALLAGLILMYVRRSANRRNTA